MLAYVLCVANEHEMAKNTSTYFHLARQPESFRLVSVFSVMCWS